MKRSTAWTDDVEPEPALAEVNAEAPVAVVPGAAPQAAPEWHLFFYAGADYDVHYYYVNATRAPSTHALVTALRAVRVPARQAGLQGAARRADREAATQAALNAEWAMMAVVVELLDAVTSPVHNSAAVTMAAREAKRHTSLGAWLDAMGQGFELRHWHAAEDDFAHERSARRLPRNRAFIPHQFTLEC